jgi:DNA-binding HxlR family transcriptional regulator
MSNAESRATAGHIHPYDEWTPMSRALDIVGHKWKLLVVRTLALGPVRFTELQRRLPGISTEQLRKCLKDLTADEVVTRTRHREVPPRVNYELSDSGRSLLNFAILPLSRWGARWAWSDPGEKECINITSLLIELSMMTQGGPELDRSLELIITDGKPGSHDTQEERLYLFPEFIRIRLQREPNPDAPPECTVSGSSSAWILALSSKRDHSALQMTGDTALGRRIVENLSLNWQGGRY